ncbi:hypothetical protein [Chlorobium sp. N1]|uniref:hypothetical protein n=1 Tax=Chlorobium sp. N1 TaxID=2491138 RepID=UPI00103A5BDB|nr:hypothetical protein [Chlorobium sp. N1]TCD47285.1 hypothetical protein E0L29_08305 [Chlorobium sp. N1]
MKKTIAAVAFAAAMAMGTSTSFAGELAQISSVGLNSSGIAAASGIAGNFANVNNSAFQIVSMNQSTGGGWFNPGSSSSAFSLTDLNTSVNAVSGAQAQTSSWFGGSSAASLLNAQMLSF